jgi:hypothetical protein
MLNLALAGAVYGLAPTPESQVRIRLPAGAKRIRTLGPTRVRRPRQPQGSLLTPRWSKPDSNLSSLRRPKIKWSNPEPGRSRR